MPCDECGKWLKGCVCNRPEDKSNSDLTDLLSAVSSRLKKAADRYDAPLKLVIDTRGPQYIYIAYASERELYQASEMDEIGT